MDKLTFICIIAVILGVIAIVLAMVILDYLKDKFEIEHTCQHEWEDFKHIDVFANANSTLPCNEKVILRCKNCGELKTVIV